MEGIALIVFAVATLMYVALYVIVSRELVSGERLVAANFRGRLDSLLERFQKKVAELIHDFTEYVVKLGWYYSVHSFLRTVMQFLVNAYEFFEHKFEQNHSRAEVLKSRRKERQTEKSTHLAEMATHKESVALSPEQQAELRQRKLEED